MSEKIVLIDGHSILNRAFYGVPDLTNKSGLHTNAVYGFLNIMFKILSEENPQYLTVAFDVKEPTFRHKMYSEYKGTRKPMPEELRQQVPVIKQVLNAMGIVTVERAGYEADDILGTIAKRSAKAGMEVSVISGDRDLLQLADDKIKVRIPKTKRGVTEIEDYNTKEVLEKYQVTPLQIIELKALMGDTADNIPGAPGIGEKTATKLIVEYGSVENAYAHADDIKPNKARESLKENYDKVLLSKTLATINTDCELDYNIQEAKLKNLYTKEAYELFKELEFKNMLSKFEISGEALDNTKEIFKCINELAQAEEIFGMAAKASKCAMVTAGASDNFSVAICIDEGAVYYIKNEGFMTLEYISEKVYNTVKNTKELIVYDIKGMMKQIGRCDISNIFDCEIAAYLINPLVSEYSYSDMAKEYADKSFPAKEELIGKLSMEQALKEKADEAMTLLCYMAYTAFKVSDAMKEKLKSLNEYELFKNIEMPLALTLYDMEAEGMLVKKEELKLYGEKLAIRIDELEKIIYNLAGEEFNINSPKQLGVILFEKLKLPNAKKTKTGYSTSADVLEKLSSQYEIVQYILEYRQLAKLKSTYADGLANFISDDGRIHSTFNQTITATGRISSTEPNLQNIPIRMELGRLIRKVFVPKEDCIFIDADYSQIELRVLAHISGDQRLIEAYKADEDIHKITASEVFHVPLDKVDAQLRRNAKAVNFGIVYGISSFGLSQDLSIGRKEASQYIEKYFETYPQVKQFLDNTVKNAKNDGYVTTLFGRRRPVPELSSGNFMQRSFGERVAMNSPIQGTAADIIKIAMINVNNRLRKENLKSRLILQVHDELLIEAYKDEADIVKKILNEEMRGAAKLDVMLEIDMNEGNDWYEAH